MINKQVYIGSGALVCAVVITGYLVSISNNPDTKPDIVPTPTTVLGKSLYIETNENYLQEQTHPNPYITPIDSKVKRFIYPDSSFSLDIPSQSKVTVEMQKFSIEIQSVRAVGFEWYVDNDPEPYYLSIGHMGRGLPNFDEYTYEKIVLRQGSLVRHSYFLGGKMIETLYWFENNIFSESDLMFSFHKQGYTKDSDFNSINEIIKSITPLNGL